MCESIGHRPLRAAAQKEGVSLVTRTAVAMGNPVAVEKRFVAKELTT